MTGWAALAGIGIGGVTLAGWIFDVAILKSFFSSLAPARPNASVGILLGGIALWLSRTKSGGLRPGRPVALGCALLVAAIGLITLLEHTLVWDSGFDRLLFPAQVRAIPVTYPGRIPPGIALNLLLIGLSLLLLDVRTPRGHRPAQVLIGLQGFFALATFLGYVYGASSFFSLASVFDPVSLPGILGVCILFFGLGLVRPGPGLLTILGGSGSGSILARRFLLPVFVVPVLLDVLLRAGVRAGFYDQVKEPAVHAVLQMGFFLGLVLMTAAALNRGESALRDSEARFRTLAETLPNIVYTATPEGSLDYVNRRGVDYTGLAVPVMTGAGWMNVVHPEDVGPAIKQMEESIRTGQPYEVKERIRGADGVYRWFITRARLVRGEGGQPAQWIGTATDIDELVRTQDALNEAHRRTTVILESIADGFNSFDREFRYTYVNPSAARILRTTPERLLGRTVWEAWPKASETRFGAAFRKTMEEGLPVSVEEFYPEPLNAWLEARFYPSSDGMTVFFTDVTGRKQAEAEIRRVNEWFDLATRAAHLGIWDWDILNNRLSWDDRMYELYGIRKEDFAGAYEAWLGGVHPEDAARSDEESRRALRGEKEYDTEFRVVCPDGSVRHLRAIAEVLRDADGNPLRMTGVNYDITERKRLQDERLEVERLKVLSRSHQLWQDTFDSITDLVILIDGEDHILKVNRAFLVYFRLALPEVIGKNCCAFFDEKEFPVHDHLRKRSLKGQVPAVVELTDAARSRIFDVAAYDLTSDLEGSTGHILVARDVTEKRENEIRLILSERLAAIGQVAAGVAHEINTPLATISCCAEGLLSRAEKGQSDPGVQQNYLQIIRDEVYRCKAITEEMLSFVRQTSYEMRPIDVGDAVERAIELIRLQGRFRNVDLKREFAVDLPPARARTGDLRQALLVILSNALDAVEEHGTLLVRTGVEGKNVFVDVEDSGHGILPENRERVFDLFFTTKASRGGTGIGLHIARRIIRAMSGEIAVKNGSLPGAAFRVTLPLSLE